MSDDYSKIDADRLKGTETLVGDPKASTISINDFWSWSASDLLSNATRGVFAEFLVAADLGVADGVRNEWGAYDLKTRSGTTVEVKSSAHIQSWFQKNYVFCLLKQKDQNKINPLDMFHWEF